MDISQAPKMAKLTSTTCFSIQMLRSSFETFAKFSVGKLADFKKGFLGMYEKKGVYLLCSGRPSILLIRRGVSDGRRWVWVIRIEGEVY